MTLQILYLIKIIILTLYIETRVRFIFYLMNKLTNELNIYITETRKSGMATLLEVISTVSNGACSEKTDFSLHTGIIYESTFVKVLPT